jgi:hypothetical protein
MFLAVMSLSSDVHSPCWQPVSQQKVTITRPLQLWLINLLLGLQTAAKMCPQMQYQMNKKNFRLPYN